MTMPGKKGSRDSEGSGWEVYSLELAVHGAHEGGPRPASDHGLVANRISKGRDKISGQAESSFPWWQKHEGWITSLTLNGGHVGEHSGS